MDESAHILGQKHGKKRKDKVSARVSKSENEKRRRAQENRHIEDIAELIAENTEEQDIVPAEKPDKFAILEKADRYLHKMHRDPDEGTADGVIQQSQVSSSGKSSGILSSDVLGALLLEVLDGFLFLVDRQGKVQFTSDQITQYLDYSKDELVGNSIYNIIDTVDHAEIAKSLVPLSSDGNYILCSEENMKNRKFNCKLRKKGDGQGFITMQLQTFLNDDDRDIEGSDSGSGSNKYLVCVAQKMHVDKMCRAEEFFITKQDLQGKIVSCDTTGLSSSDWMSINLVGQNIQDICQEKDKPHLQKHHSEVLKNGGNTSILYHFKLHEKRSVFVQTNSQLFKNPTTHKPEFIMSKHIVNDPESNSATNFLARNILGATGNRARGDLSLNLRMGTKNAPPPSAMGLSLLSDSTNAAANAATTVNHPDNHSITIDHLNSDNDLRELLKMFQGSGSEWEQNLFDSSSPGGSGGNYAGAGNNLGILGGGSNSMNNVINSQQQGAVGSSLHSTQVSWSSLANSISSTNSAAGGSMGMTQQMSSQLPMSGSGYQHHHHHLHHHSNSPISPGYVSQQPQRSPGFSGGSQRSPGFTPSPVAQQRSPASSHRSPGDGGFAQPAMLMGSSSLQALQSLDANMGVKLQRHMQQQGNRYSGSNSKPPPYKDAKDAKPYLLKDAGQTAKLRQLLENDPTNGAANKNHFLHNLSPGSMMGPRFPFSKDSSNISGASGGSSGLRTNSRSSSISSKGPHTPLQSPRPRPSPSEPVQEPQSTSLTSPPQQPQSTSLDTDPDSSRDPRNKPEDNKILKELLECNDYEDDENSGDGCEQASSTSNIETKERSENEAEPKKTDNTLLIKLLNESRGMESARAAGGKSKSELLQHLLQLEDDEDDQRTPNAESTSMDDLENLGLEQKTTGSAGLSLGSHKKGGAADQHKSANQAELRALLGRMWDQQTDEQPQEKKQRLDDRTSAADSTETDSRTIGGGGGGILENGPAAKNRMLANLLSKSSVCDDQLDLKTNIDVSSTPQPRQGSMIQNLGQLHSNVLPRKGPGRPPGSTKRSNSSSGSVVQKGGGGPWSEKQKLNTNSPYNVNISAKDKVASPVAIRPPLPHQPVSAASAGTDSGSNSIVMNPSNTKVEDFSGVSRDNNNISSSSTNSSSNVSVGTTSRGSNPQGVLNSGNTLEGIMSNMLDSIGDVVVASRNPLDTPTPPSSEALILQEASELEQDLCLRQRQGTLNLDSDDSALLNSLLQVLDSRSSTDNNTSINLPSGGVDSASAGGFSQQDLESLLNLAPTTAVTPSGMSEQQAINDIQQELMSVEPTMNSSTQQSGPNNEPVPAQGYSQGPIGLNNPASQGPASLGMLTGHQSMANNSNMGDGGRFTNLVASNDQKSSPALKGPPLLPGNHGNSEANIEAQIRQLQAGSLGEKFISGSAQNTQLLPSNHPLKPPPHQSLQQQQPVVGGNMSGAVRPALLMQQQQKRLRAQMHTRLALQQRGFSQTAGSGGTRGYTQGRNPTGPGFPKMPSPGIPNNFSEIMNSTIAPNVSLERNQVPPGPMSPQFPQSHPLAVRGAGRMPYGRAQGPQQWNQRASQAMMAGGAMVQNNRAQQFNNISPRQMGPAGPMPPQISPEQPQFSDGAAQFGPQGPSPQPRSQMMLSQQQHMRARQMAMQQQGLHSPHGPQQQQSYPGNTGLVTPHQKLSPNNQISPQQAVAGGYSPGSAGSLVSSPNYSQNTAGLPQGYSANLLPGGRGLAPSGRGLQASGQGYLQGPRVSTQHTQQESFASSQQKSPVGSSASGGGGSGGGGNTASKLVRQQLQGFLTTRVQQQQQQATDLNAPTNQPPDLPPPQPPDNGNYDNGELPREVLDTITELSELGQGCPDNSFQEELNKVELEAKERCRQFQQLSYQGNDSLAGSLFRSQLLTSPQSTSSLPDLLTHKSDAPVTVVGRESRPSLDLPKSQEQTNNSLLQKLLSEDS